MGTFLLLIATGPRLSIVWDEGYTLGRVARVQAWFRALADPPRFAASWSGAAPTLELVQREEGEVRPSPSDIDTRFKLFRRPALDYFWPFAREEPHGHPPFYALLAGIGEFVIPFAEPLARARLGPMLLYSLVAGSLYGFFASRWGPWPAILAAGAWVLQPRLFAHGHYALYDGPLTALWVASILAFGQAVDPAASSRGRRAWIIVFGLILGAAAATKLTGWFLPLPFLAWTALRRDRRGVEALIAGGLIGLVALYLLCPPFWGQPIAGVSRFLDSNLGRAQTTRIPTLFLGHVYLTPKESLPAYNTLVWTVFLAPVGFLILAILGVVRSMRLAKSEPFGLLAVGHWAFLLLLRSLPHTPGHDAERQFLAAFGVLAVVAGLGAVEVVERWRRIGRGIVVAALAEGAVSVALMMPVPLSYYSPVVGGLPGAVSLGMEPTYYWDALDDEALRWLNTHTPSDEKVRFATYPTSWIYLRQTGRLKPRMLPWEPGRTAWYVVQNRAGSLTRGDRELIERIGPRHVLVEKWGVPLIWAFPGDESPTPTGGPP